MFEMKVLYCAHTGCIGRQFVHLVHVLCPIKMWNIRTSRIHGQQKYAHARCTGSEICAPGSQNVHTGNIENIGPLARLNIRYIKSEEPEVRVIGRKLEGIYATFYCNFDEYQ